MSDSPVVQITECTGEVSTLYSPSTSPSTSPPMSPSLLSPSKTNNSKPNSFNLCSDLIDYFDNKFAQQARGVLEDMREEQPKDITIKKVNDLCSQMSSLSDILTSLQQDLIQQLLKNVNFELGVFNDRMRRVHTQEDINKCTVEIIQQLVFLLESIMQAEQKDFFEVNDLIDLPVIANLESHVFDEIWRKYLKPRNLTILPFSPQRTSSLFSARRSIRRSMISDTPMGYDPCAMIRRDNVSKGVQVSSHRDSDGYSTSSSRPASQELEEFISVEEMNQTEHLRMFSASTTSLDSGFQNDQQCFSFFPQLDLQEWSCISSVSSSSLASCSTESDEDDNSFLPYGTITLGRGSQLKRGTLRRDRRGSQLDMSVALEYVKFKVSTAKKHSVLNKQSDVNNNKTQMLVIQVESNMEEIVPHSFSIVRTIDEFQTFYQAMQKRHGKIGNNPKELKLYLRTRNFERKVEDVLNHLGINSQTRNDDILMKFIREENGLSLITDGLDKHLHVEKTFFTPSRSHTPGVAPLIEVASKPQKREDIPLGTLRRGEKLNTESCTSEEVEKVINIVMREGHKVLITTTENNHEFIDAATLDILIENLTTIDQSRDNSKVPDPNFIQQFILGHRHFLKNVEFFKILVKKYDEINKSNLQKEQSVAWQMLAKIRLLRVVIIWLETFYPDFYMSSEMSGMLTDFIEKVAENNEATSSVHRIRKILLEQQEYFDSKQDWIEKRQSKNPSVLLGTTLLKSHDYKPIMIAQQLSLIQMDVFKKVGFYEICIKILEGNNSSKNGSCTPNLDAFISRSNQESTWVMSEILSCVTNKARVEVAERAISVAKHCYRLKNYNTMMAILAGLQNRLVNRTKVINGINDKSRSTFEKLKSVMDFSGNFKNYRRETRTLLIEGNKPCVPFFALYMKDFTHMNENKKYVGEGLINFTKIRNMHKVLVELKKLQRFPFDGVQENLEIAMQCQNLFTLNEEKLEDMCKHFSKRP